MHDQKMPVQSIASNECLFTQRALVLFVDRVHRLYVFLQMTVLLEGHRTLRTFVRPYIRVRLTVIVQM